MLKFVGTYIGEKLLDWAILASIVVIAGTEKEQATRQAFREAAVAALTEVCDESVVPTDKEAAEALGEYLATWLTEPSIAEMLFRAANANTAPDAALVVDHIRRSGVDPSIAPFEMEDFIKTFTPKLSGVVGREIRSQGLTQTAIADKLDVLLERTEPRESAIRAARSRADGPQRRPVVVGIRSFTRRAEDMDNEMDKLLRLEWYFEDRRIKYPELWREAIYPELETFLQSNLNGYDRYLLHLCTHTSVAFACGFLLDPKSGVDVVPVQRTSGRQEWRPVLDPNMDRRGLSEKLWGLSPVPLREGGHDLVVAVSVTHDVFEDTEAYARKDIPTASRILHFEVKPGAGRHSVRDGTHAMLLAEDLLARVRKARTPEERAGTVHLFAAAPAGLMFFAGRLSRGLGRLTLYEYDFEGGALGAYVPSLVLPQPTGRSTGATERRGG